MAVTTGIFLRSSVVCALMIGYSVLAAADIPSSSRQARIFYNLNGTANPLATSIGTLLMTLPALLLPVILLIGLGALAMALFSKFDDDDYKRRSFENFTGLSVDNILSKLDRVPDFINKLADRY